LKIRNCYLLIPVLIVLVTLTASATASMLVPASEKAKEKAKSADNSPWIAKNEQGDLILSAPGLEKRIHIHYAKPNPECGNGVCEPGEKNICPGDCGSIIEESVCYDLIGRGAIWKEPVNPDNPDGLSEDFLLAAVSDGAAEWDSYTRADLFGSYSTDNDSSWDMDAPDGRNELLFGDYPEEGVIAITVTWGYFSGPPKFRRIVEFDILFNTDFIWGDATQNPQVIDFQNILTHEIGHGLGLADLYEPDCSSETMYGYSDYGEVLKRDLNSGDITGIQELYGE
jgi:hypothetical protein